LGKGEDKRRFSEPMCTNKLRYLALYTLSTPTFRAPIYLYAFLDMSFLILL